MAKRLKPTKGTIVVAMSGGVDSAVTAALLVERGYHVIGITLQLYDHGQGAIGGKTCCAGVDIVDARRVAQQLDIPHYVLNYEERFRQAVIDDFRQSYLRGQTPIPCIQCNQKIKFSDLMDTARELGAQALATGHYAHRVHSKNGKLELWQPHDLNRDQTYFLFNTRDDQLEYLRFPLGTITKDETRRIAHTYHLPIADKPDSQDICFVPNGNYRVLMSTTDQAGDIIDIDGRVLGQHQGISGYTIGQRRGLGIGGRKDALGEPLYVIDINAKAHQVIVGPRHHLARQRIWLDNLNWIGFTPPPSLEASIKYRSQQSCVPATITTIDGRYCVTLAQSQDGIAPGQACVFYDGKRVLGGGWITAEL